MKKQYVFIWLIIVMLYIIYSIIDYKYKEYKINSLISYIEKSNEDIKLKINEAKNLIEYRKSKSYVNKVLKEEQSLKNKWEKVIFITTEKTFDKFAKNDFYKSEINEYNDNNWNDSIINWMTIYQKWMYFLFKKDIREN